MTAPQVTVPDYWIFPSGAADVHEMTIFDVPRGAAGDPVRQMTMIGAVAAIAVRIVQGMHQTDRRLVQSVGYGRGAHAAARARDR
jgi:hypothetical protein